METPVIILSVGDIELPMLTYFTTVRSRQDTSQRQNRVMPNGVSASFIQLTPTATNSVSPGLVPGYHQIADRSGRPFQEAPGARMVFRLSAEPGRQSCSSGQQDYCCSARSRFPRPGRTN